MSKNEGSIWWEMEICHLKTNCSGDDWIEELQAEGFVRSSFGMKEEKLVGDGSRIEAFPLKVYFSKLERACEKRKSQP